MRRIYSFFMYGLIPYFIVRLWWKGRRFPAYRARLSERFSLGQEGEKPVDLWVHAVSLGEVNAATPLVRALLALNYSVLITSTTPTGSAQVTTVFGDQVSHRYLPYDLPVALRRFFSQTKPRLGIIMETELWPNLVHQAHRAGVPLMLANGRLSQRSFQRYALLKTFMRPMLKQFSLILAQTKEDAGRLIELGADPDRVQVAGNMKFDLSLRSVDGSFYQEFKQRFGVRRVVLMIASTHEDEERQILLELRRAQQAIPNLVVLIAPRHPERFQGVYQLSTTLGFKTGLRSIPEKVSTEDEVIVVDSLGELLGFYQIADYAFVGGSLVPVGGHNVLEPIAMKIPVLSGNQVHNFKEICRLLEEAHALCLVSDAKQLVDALIRIHHDATLKQEMIERASQVLESNRGALDRHLAQINRLLLEENKLHHRTDTMPFNEM